MGCLTKRRRDFWKLQCPNVRDEQLLSKVAHLYKNLSPPKSLMKIFFNFGVRSELVARIPQGGFFSMEYTSLAMCGDSQTSLTLWCPRMCRLLDHIFRLVCSPRSIQFAKLTAVVQCSIERCGKNPVNNPFSTCNIHSGFDTVPSFTPSNSAENAMLLRKVEEVECIVSVIGNLCLHVFHLLFQNLSLNPFFFGRRSVYDPKVGVHLHNSVTVFST